MAPSVMSGVIRIFKPCSLCGLYRSSQLGRFALRKGHHEGLISLETFQAVQRRIKEDAKAPARKDISTDFPLRGFIVCNDCDKPLTANWSTSKTGKKHPYYMCFSKGCDSYRKSIRRDVLEGQFGEMVQNLQPTQGLIAIAKVMFKHAWKQRMAQAEGLLQAIKHDAAKIDKQIEGLLDRIVQSENSTLITAYETRLVNLEQDKLVLAEKLQKGAKPAYPFDQMFELACNFLASPWKLWDFRTIRPQTNRAQTGFFRAHCLLPQTRTSNPKNHLTIQGVRRYYDWTKQYGGHGGIRTHDEAINPILP